MFFRLLIATTLACLAMVQPVFSETITHNGREFTVDSDLRAKNSELYDLILVTESMDDAERQYWFDIMPSMNQAQIDRLFDILDTERRKLTELEIKYQKEIKSLNRKHSLEFYTLKLKEAFKNDPLEGASLFLPILDKNSIPPVVLRRFVEYDDIPQLLIADMVPGSLDDTLVPALVTVDIFEGLFEAETTSDTTRQVFVTYAVEILERRVVYERIFGNDLFAEYVKFGASQASRLGLESAVIRMSLLAPDLVDPSAYETPEAAIARLTADFNTYVSLNGEGYVANFLWTLEGLAGLRAEGACQESCQDMLDRGAVALLQDRDAVISEITQSLRDRPNEYAYYRAITLDYLSLFVSDRQKRDALQALSDRLGDEVGRIVDEVISPKFVPLSSDDDIGTIGDFLLSGFDHNGKWSDDATRWGWYSELMKHYHAGTIHPLTDAVQGAWIREKAARQIDNVLKLEGPLIEVQTLAVLELLISGDCANQAERLDELQIIAREQGKRPRSSAAGYREIAMIKALSTLRITRKFCSGGQMNDPAEGLDWHAILIGLGDNTPGAPNSEIATDDDYYLGDIPHNDVALMKQALEGSLMPWQITTLIGEKVTKQNVIDTVNRVFAEADGNDQIIVYFSGHGRQGNNNDRDHYMGVLDEQEVGVKEFGWAALHSSAKHTAFIFDMCLTDGTVSKGTVRKTNAYAGRMSAQNSGLKDSVNLIFATEDGMVSEASRESGYSTFTALLAPILEGKVSVGPDENISMQEALDNIREKFLADPRYVQVPQFQGVRGLLDWNVAGYKG